MPLEGLDGYGSDSGSSIQSRNSETVPKTPQDHDGSDCNATEADFSGEPSEEQIFDGHSDKMDQHTPAQKSKRRCSPAASSAEDDVVGPSDSESFLSERDELFGPKRYKRGFKRPHLQWDSLWELVSSWNKDHVAPDDYQGEIARILAKSMHDARLEVTPRYNARVISYFCFKR